jgi:hypothetical protein
MGALRYELGKVPGKNCCSPLILNDLIVFWPSVESSQSMKAWPSAFFTLGCLAAFIEMAGFELLGWIDWVGDIETR